MLQLTKLYLSSFWSDFWSNFGDFRALYQTKMYFFGLNVMVYSNVFLGHFEGVFGGIFLYLKGNIRVFLVI